MGKAATNVNSTDAQVRNDEWLGELPSEELVVENQDGAAPAESKLEDDLEGKSAKEIRAKIEETRNEMTHTIDAIQDKLDPDKLKAKAAAKLHDATIGTASRAAQAVVEKVAELTPQPRHNTGKTTHESNAPDWQKTMERTKQWVKDNPKIVGYAVTAGVLILGALAKKRSNARALYYTDEFRD